MFNHTSKPVEAHLALTRIKAIGAAVLLIATSGMPVAASAAAESTPCGPRPELVKQLSKKFHEEPIAIGLTNKGSLVEVLTSDNGSTWTIMISQPNGSSCLVAAGEGWEVLKHVAKGERGA